ncbi:hybrid sensor histidine kinase/response regulator [Leptospira sp. 96542]|nr:hybrid sensor histidine kinase/response regulator [Leptospira sp. 96542]
MLAAKEPDNEEERLSALAQYNIMDSPEEELFDEITKLASYICQTPISLISLLDETRQWFKSHHGLEVRETKRELAFCAHAILGDKMFIVEDAKKDERFFDNPLVVDDPNVIFYAGFPLDIDGKHKLGTLCVIDNKPRTLTKEQIAMLESLGKQVVHLIAMRKVNIQLTKEKEFAIKANAAKRDFIAAISHDIRNPLNSLLGMSEMIREATTDPLINQYVEQIQNAGEVILNLVNDTIELSRLEDKTNAIHKDWFNIHPTLASLEKFFSWEAERKRIQFVLINQIPNTIQFFSDHRKIEKILWNLTANAVKFTNKGLVECKLFLNDNDSIQPELMIEVRDTGPGIPEEVKDNLFEKYNSFKPEGCLISGSGLGLSIVKLSVEGLYGSIQVDSLIGEGTKFTVHIPIQIKEVEADFVSYHMQQSFEPSQFPNVNVLIADDSSLNRKVLKNYLKHYPFDIIEAGDGAEAELCLSKENFGLVFLDVEMPKKHGTEIALACQKKGSKSVFIACTGLCLPEERQNIMESGFQYYLPKPYIKEELFHMLAEIANRYF